MHIVDWLGPVITSVSQLQLSAASTEKICDYVITCKCYYMQTLWHANHIILHTAAINSHSISLQLNSKLPNLVHWIYFNSLLTAISHYIHSSGLKHANTPVFPCASLVYDPLFLGVNIKYQEMSYINTTLPWQMA